MSRKNKKGNIITDQMEDTVLGGKEPKLVSGRDTNFYTELVKDEYDAMNVETKVREHIRSLIEPVMTKAVRDR